MRAITVEPALLVYFTVKKQAFCRLSLKEPGIQAVLGLSPSCQRPTFYIALPTKKYRCCRHFGRSSTDAAYDTGQNRYFSFRRRC